MSGGNYNLFNYNIFGVYLTVKMKNYIQTNKLKIKHGTIFNSFVGTRSKYSIYD